MFAVLPIVIVHGASHRPAHYDALADRLRARGAHVVVPDVGGLPLPESTRRLQAVVDDLVHPPIVVGHSFGGAAAGALVGAAHMVFLTAWVLDVAETCALLLHGAGGRGGGEAFMTALRPSADGSLFTIDPAQAIDLFYADCSPCDAERAVGLLRADIAANFDLAPTAAYWHDTPSTYVIATQDRTWPAALPPIFAARCTRTVRMPTSHSPFLSRPDEITDLILRSA